MPTHWFAPLSYMALGALVLFAVQQVAKFARRSMPRDSGPGSRSERRFDFSAGVVDQVRQETAPERYWLWDNLTTREMEIASLVVRGQRNAEVARELHISPYTVETHLKHIYIKLNVSSRTELAHVIQELVD